MSNQQQLAEHGVGFCMWGIGLISGSTALAGLASVAVVGTLFRENLRRCPRHLSKAAIGSIKQMLTESGEFSEEAIATAAGILAEDRGKISVDTDLLRSWEARQDFPAALYKQVFASAPPPEEDGIADILRAVIAEAFTELRKDETFNKLFTQESLVAIEGKLDTMEERLIEAATLNVEEREELASLRTERKFLISIVQNFVPDAGDDFAGALASITSALATAAKRLDLGTMPSNTGEAVDAIVAEVRRLNREGDTRAAMSKLREDTARRRAERERRIAEDTRILDETIAQAELVNDAEAYAEFQLEKVQLTTPDAEDAWKALNSSRSERFQTSERLKAPFHLDAAIAVARACVDIAPTPYLRAGSLNNLAMAVGVRGKRAKGDESVSLLAEAVGYYDQALIDFSLKEFPVQWAMTQGNKGNVLSNQGARRSGDEGIALLKLAVEAYDAALSVNTQERDAIAWARHHINKSGTLRELASATPGPEGLALFASAEDALNAALQVFTPKDHAMEWGAAQLNLGNVRTNLAEQTQTTEKLTHLGNAIAAFEASLTVFSQSEYPVPWATAQKNLGIAKRALSSQQAMEHRRRALEEAHGHIEAALGVFDEDHSQFEHSSCSRIREGIQKDLAALQS